MQIYISKKIFFLLLTLGMLIIYYIFQGQDDRPIKFENYNDQEFQKIVKEKFATGEFIGIGIEQLVVSKIDELSFEKVLDENKKMYRHNTIYVMTATYRAPFFSFSPLSKYRIIISADENLKFLYATSQKTNFIEYFWW